MGIRGRCQCLPCRHGRSVIARLEVEAGRCSSFCTCNTTAGRPHWCPDPLRIFGLFALTSPCISAGATLSGLRHSLHRAFHMRDCRLSLPSIPSPLVSMGSSSSLPTHQARPRASLTTRQAGQAPPRASLAPLLPLLEVTSMGGGPRPQATYMSGAHGPQASEYKYLPISSSVSSLLHPHSSHSSPPFHPFHPFPPYSITFNILCYYS